MEAPVRLLDAGYVQAVRIAQKAWMYFKINGDGLVCRTEVHLGCEYPAPKICLACRKDPDHALQALWWWERQRRGRHSPWETAKTGV